MGVRAGGVAPQPKPRLAAMQDELAKLDPKALEQLPQDLKDALAAQGRLHDQRQPVLPGGGRLAEGLPGLGGGLPGLGGGLPKFPGLPGKKK